MARDALTGALAGVAAGWLMNRVTSALYRREPPLARMRESQANAGRYSNEIAAQKLCRLLGRELDDEQLTQAGRALHAAMSVGAGALYGVARRRLPVLARGAGTLFGVTFFLAVDELANVALGLAPGPRAYPWQTHVRGLAGHLVFGAATEAQLRALDHATFR
jgi:uncharacterized membrane protein YagU involved in acid resistance